LRVGWVNLQGDGLDLIDWDIGLLTEGIKWISLGSEELSLGWSGMGENWGSNLNVLVIVVVVFVVMVL
jgi:hypothetical protein